MFEEQDKIKDRIRKLFAISEGVADEANSDEIKESMANEAMAAAQMAEKLLFKYKLSRADVIQEKPEEAEVFVPVFGMTIVPDFIKRANARVASKRKIWLEELAKIVAEGYFCKSAPRPETKEVVFYGLDMDREIAIYVFTRLAESANELAKIEWKKAEKAAGTVNFETLEEIPYVEEEVFTVNFHRGFREQIKEIQINREDEEDDHAKEIFQRAKEETREYFEANRNRSLESPYGFELAFAYEKKIGENLWAIEVGKKAANKVSTRINSFVEDKGAIEKVNKKIAGAGEVFILIDASGSMWGDKMSQAKAGAVDYASQAIEKGYAVGVISFAWQAKLIVEPRKEINILWHNAVSNIKATGSTNLADAIVQARQRFTNSRSKRVICIVTDGQPDSRERALSAATEAKKVGIEITFVATDDADKEFLNQLASMEGIKVTAGELRTGIRSMAGLLPAAN